MGLQFSIRHNGIKNMPGYLRGLKLTSTGIFRRLGLHFRPFTGKSEIRFHVARTLRVRADGPVHGVCRLQ